MISAIVPSYKNPKCLDICLRSFTDNTFDQLSSDIICIIDGFAELYKEIFTRYQNYNNIKFILNHTNKGMPLSINIGVYASSNPFILVLNDDNVFPKHWDKALIPIIKENYIISPNQIEATNSIFNFIQKDFGSVDNFRYEEFVEIEQYLRVYDPVLTNDGEIFPFCMSKKAFMSVGGFDLIYPSPFVCDWDFFLKLELLNYSFFRTRCINFYHFGSVSTKNATDIKDSAYFKNSEDIAHQIFLEKWGFPPCISRPSNSHRPDSNQIIRGIQYND